MTLEEIEAIEKEIADSRAEYTAFMAADNKRRGLSDDSPYASRLDDYDLRPASTSWDHYQGWGLLSVGELVELLNIAKEALGK